MKTPPSGSSTGCERLTTPLAPGHQSRRKGAFPAAVLTLLGLGAALVLAAQSDGVYHDDDICHYLFALDSLSDAKVMLHQWARPGYNLPTAVVAHFFGIFGCRVFSALLTAGTAYAAFLLAREVAVRAGDHGRWPVLAPVLVWLQPLTMTLALTTLTETPAALYMTLGAWLYLRDNRAWGCAAFSAMFVTRYETLALAPILAGAVLYDAFLAGDRKLSKVIATPWLWSCGAALLWAPLAYGLAAYLVYGLGASPGDVDRSASPLYMFIREYTTEYDSGPLHHFISIWPQAAGLGVLVLAVAGAVWLNKRIWLASALAGALVALHSLLFWRGSFATGGYARFLVPLSGIVAAAAAAGLHAAWQGKRKIIVAVVFVVPGAWILLIVMRWSALVSDEHRGYVVAFAVSTTAVLVALGVIALRAEPSVRLWLGRLAAGGALLLAGLQASAQVQPLSLLRTSDHYHRVLLAAVRAIDESEYRDSRGITQHVLIRFLRKNTDALFSNQDALDKWRRARPGTLFFWENKYCYKKLEPQSTVRLYEEMFDLGRSIYRGGQEESIGVTFRPQGQGAAVEVFVRLPDQREGRDVAAATECAVE